VDLVGFSEVHPQGMRPFGECPNPLFLAPHPLFGGGKSPHFSSFFVFFYIDFVFFFMIFAYFPIFLSNFLLVQTQIGRFREFAQGRTFHLTKGGMTGMSLILYCGHFFMLFRYAMNDIGDDAPYHEAVGLVDTDGSVGLVPGNEPAESSAFVDLELLDGKLAIYEGYDEVAVGWFYLAVDDGKVAVKDAGSCHAVA
jgi:hypothetical protein